MRIWRNRQTDTSEGPAPPENLRAIMADGRVIALECVYAGRSSEGLHRWVLTRPLGDTPVEVLCDLLPGRTEIILDLDGDLSG